MIDDKGRQVKEAGPCLPVEVLGLSGVPSRRRSLLTVVENEARAREVAAYRQSVIDTKRTTTAPANLDTMFSALKEKQAVEFPLVVKADVQGSVEAIVAAINRISNDDIKVRVLHAGVGGITESDVTLAGASGAPIIGFNVRPNAKAREIAERQGVAHAILRRDLRADRRGAGGDGRRARPADRSRPSSAAPRSARSSRPASTARRPACWSPRAIIRKALKARITRDDVIIYNGAIASLRRFKDDVAGGPRGPRMRRHLRKPHRHQGRATSSRRSRSRSANGRFDASARVLGLALH